MKSLIATAAVVCLLLASADAAFAQTRTRRSTPQRRRPATSSSSTLDATRFNAQRLELAGLAKDMTRFLYLYGRLSKDLELTGTQAESADVAGRTKAGLMENVRAMRDRLDQLEARFRFTQGLERPYQALQGVSGRADQAAQSVAANQFDRAGRILVEISGQLTDALLEIQ